MTGSTLPPELAHIANEIRRRLEHHHGVDTSQLDDQTFLTDVIVLKEIEDNRGMGIVEALAVYSEKFMDLAELAGEMVTTPEGTRTYLKMLFGVGQGLVFASAAKQSRKKTP